MMGTAYYYGEVQDVSPAVLPAVFGQKVVPLDIPLEERKQLIGLQSDLRALDEQMGTVRRNQGLSGAEKQLEIRRLQDKRRKAIQDFQNR
jgi:hypothetical protein